MDLKFIQLDETTQKEASSTKKTESKVKYTLRMFNNP